MLTYAVW